MEILIVSGLYGLIFPDELIQEYDCHISDIESGITSRKVSQIWRPVLTDMLLEYMRCQAAAGKPIRRGYDFLSESLYQKLFDWRRIRESKVDVYHRIFLTLAGPDTLSPLASVLAGNSNLMLDGGDPKLGQWYALPEEEGSVQFSFEFPIGSNSRATREGDIEKVRKEMLTQLGMLQARSPQCFELLVLAEHSWRKVREMNDFDFGSLVVSFTRPAENLLKEFIRLPPVPKPTFGTMVAELEHHHSLGYLYRYAWLNSLRNEGAHGRNVSQRDSARKARTLANLIIREVSAKLKP